MPEMGWDEWKMIEMILNADGDWVPAIPLPFSQGFLKKCPVCRARFLRHSSYLWHYVLRHVLKLTE